MKIKDMTDDQIRSLIYDMTGNTPPDYQMTLYRDICAGKRLHVEITQPHVRSIYRRIVRRIYSLLGKQES